MARAADGAEKRGRGQNVFTLGGDGRIVDVVGSVELSGGVVRPGGTG